MCCGCRAAKVFRFLRVLRLLRFSVKGLLVFDSVSTKFEDAVAHEVARGVTVFFIIIIMMSGMVHFIAQYTDNNWTPGNVLIPSSWAGQPRSPLHMMHFKPFSLAALFACVQRASLDQNLRSCIPTQTSAAICVSTMPCTSQ